VVGYRFFDCGGTGGVGSEDGDAEDRPISESPHIYAAPGSSEPVDETFLPMRWSAGRRDQRRCFPRQRATGKSNANILLPTGEAVRSTR
jgi:hypothetical protein